MNIYEDIYFADFERIRPEPPSPSSSYLRQRWRTPLRTGSEIPPLRSSKILVYEVKMNVLANDMKLDDEVNITFWNTTQAYILAMTGQVPATAVPTAS